MADTKGVSMLWLSEYGVPYGYFGWKGLRASQCLLIEMPSLTLVRKCMEVVLWKYSSVNKATECVAYDTRACWQPGACRSSSLAGDAVCSYDLFRLL